MPRGSKSSKTNAAAEHALKEKKRGAKALPRSSEADAEALVHELQVHQIELEMQNHELVCARTLGEAALTRYRELFDFAPVGYATISADRRIGDINHTGAQLLGRERSRLQGTSFESLLVDTHQAAFRTLIRDAQATGVKHTGELELLRAGRTPFAVRLSATVILRAEPKVLLAFEDISEHKLREERLELTERALRDADRRKDEFLALLSHELRNPLAPIRNSLFVLSHSDPGSEASRRAQVIIDRQVTHLTRLVDDLLDVTRIARGKIQLQLEHVELGAVVRRTIEDHRGSFEARGIRLESQIESMALVVHADAARLVQVTSNLLTNALKFTSHGGRVTVALQPRGHNVVLSVSDNGTGIAQDVLAHVFEPFAQAPQTLERAPGGLGLGLAMVKGLIDLHEGQVEIQSAGLGLGTEVTVTLPLVTAPIPVQCVPRSPSRRHCRILLIEDNVDAAEALQVALSLNGHEVRVAHDGPRGLELAVSYRPEVVICDLGLPGMDGYEVARAIRANPTLHETFLLALSGYARPDDLKRARKAGFQRHLAKPTSLDKIEQLLSESAPCELPVAHAPSSAPN